MVCALRDTTGTSVLSDKSAAKVLAYLENRDERQLERPVERLASFDVLLDRCLAGIPTLSPIKVVDEQIADIRRLHDHFRNNFVHFVPKGWSIEKEGLPRIIKVALLAIELLMNSDRPMIHMSDQQRQRLVSDLQSIKLALEAA
jgi:hypothetical protein